MWFAPARRRLKRALRWDEDTYGFEYDLDIYNIVALVGHSNAMENKGLNLFPAEGIVADKETTSDEDFLLIERIIAHDRAGRFRVWSSDGKLERTLPRLSGALATAGYLVPELPRLLRPLLAKQGRRAKQRLAS